MMKGDLDSAQGGETGQFCSVAFSSIPLNERDMTQRHGLKHKVQSSCQPCHLWCGRFSTRPAIADRVTRPKTAARPPTGGVISMV